jgi:16S rRNA (adenine1518-N6/adenine1519-N6)-dimethyltransferase
LGQHFLRPASVARLVRLVDPQPDEFFLEIGPGKGALTLALAARAGRVVGVEVDARLAQALRVRAPASVEILTADALEADLAALLPARARLAGNLPYYISSPLLRRILGLRERLSDAHVMLQEEVAERVAAAPGSRDYGVLSVLFALWADVDIPLRFPPGAFDPSPRVGSAILRIRFRDRPRVEVRDDAAFERLVGQAFAQRRKTLENNLQHSYADLKQHLRSLKIEGSRRAETLSVVEFARLASALSE